jgi:hypothetical protein
MTRLVGFKGAVIDAAPECVDRLLASGMFCLCEGELMSETEQEHESEPEDEPTPKDELDEAPVLDASAFGDGGPDADDLSQMTNAQRRELLEDNGVDVPKRATKSQLVALAQEAGL